MANIVFYPGSTDKLLACGSKLREKCCCPAYITTIVEPAGAGTITGGGCHQLYDYVRIDWEANDCYRFVRFEMDGYSYHYPFLFTLYGNKVVKAIFERKTCSEPKTCSAMTGSATTFTAEVCGKVVGCTESWNHYIAYCWNFRPATITAPVFYTGPCSVCANENTSSCRQVEDPLNYCCNGCETEQVLTGISTSNGNKLQANRGYYQAINETLSTKVKYLVGGIALDSHNTNCQSATGKYYWNVKLTAGSNMKVRIWNGSGQHRLNSPDYTITNGGSKTWGMGCGDRNLKVWDGSSFMCWLTVMVTPN